MILLLSLFLALFFILVIILALVFSRKSGKQSKVDAREVLKKSSIWAGVWLFLFLLIFGVSSQYAASSKFCNLCHFEKNYVSSWKSSIHKETSCLSCHQEPGFIGFLVEKLLLIKRVGVTLELLNPKPPIITTTSSNACLQCHDNILTSVINSRGTKVAHKQIAEKGYRCTDCHNQIAHGKLVKPIRVPNMADCIDCHNGKIAFNECQGCHEERIPVKGKLTEYAKVRPQTFNSCTGCHKTDSCVTCHKMQIPHPAVFFDEIGGHGGEAKSVGKDVCVKCHQVQYCDSCHF